MVRVLLNLDALFAQLQSSTTRSLLMHFGIVESKIFVLSFIFVFISSFKVDWGFAFEVLIVKHLLCVLCICFWRFPCYMISDYMKMSSWTSDLWFNRIQLSKDWQMFIFLGKIFHTPIYRQSFTMHLLQLMTSWAVVCDVWYLEPQNLNPGETPIEFAER